MAKGRFKITSMTQHNVPYTVGRADTYGEAKRIKFLHERLTRRSCKVYEGKRLVVC